jgi:hypothetical protein
MSPVSSIISVVVISKVIINIVIVSSTVQGLEENISLSFWR